MAPRKTTLPKPLPEGFILTDTEKKKWRLGKILGQGGFGLIYLASQDVSRPVPADTAFVIKVEYQENGPLFSELKFYQRAAKPESMEEWKKSRKLGFLGIPTYWGSGLAENDSLRYRFMVMDRLGSDLQKMCEKNGGRLKKATVLQLGQGLVSVLEYIHEHEYVHADIKAANLMLGYRDPEEVYLADYGLSYRYCPDGDHKKYKENPKKGHNGTIEYTSLDAHRGLAPSRRGDLQILGFCLLQWLCGSLPWDDVLKNPMQVQEAKARLLDKLPGSVQQLSVSGASTDEVASFLHYVSALQYEEKPDYQHLRKLLDGAGKRKLDFSRPRGSAEESTSKSPDTPSKEKKAGRTRRPSKAKAESKEEKQEKSKPVPAQYIRGPPLPKPAAQQVQLAKPTEFSTWRDDLQKKEDFSVPRIDNTMATKEEDGASSAASRSLRPRRGPPVRYEEDDSGEEEEERTRPIPIPACYRRGPPLGPRNPPKQNTNTKWTVWETEDLIVTSQRPVRPQRWKPAPTNWDVSEPCWEPWDRCDERLLYHREGFRYQWLESEQRESAQEGPKQEAGSTQRSGLLSGFASLILLLLLGAALGVCLKAFHPF